MSDEVMSTLLPRGHVKRETLLYNYKQVYNTIFKPEKKISMEL